MSGNGPQFRVAEIEVSKSTLDEKILGIFRYDVDGKTKDNHATLVILAEISSTSYVYEQLLDTINEAAEQSGRALSSIESNPIARFEKLIQNLNDAVANFIKNEATPLTWNRVNIFIIQLSDGHLCFAGLGQLTNLFMQKQPDGGFRPFDLFGSLDQPPEVNPEKPFATLICGDIKTGDTLFAGSSNFQRVQQDIDLEERLKTLPPVTAALEIKQDLERNNIPDDYAAVIIAGVQLAPQVATPPPNTQNAKTKSWESLEKLRQTQEHAEALLSPVIAQLPTEEPEEILEPSGEVEDRVLEAPTPPPSEQLRAPAKTTSDQPLAAASLRSMHVAHGTSVTRKRKFQVILIALALIALAGAGWWYQQQRQFTNEQTLWNSVYDQAMDRKTRAEADLVIGNEDRARSLINEAEQMVAGLDTKTPDRQKAKEDITRGLEDLKTKLKHIVSIDHPAVAFQLPVESANTAIQTLLYYSDRLYLTGPDMAGIYQADPSNQTSKLIAVPSSTKILVGDATKDAALVVGDGYRLFAVDPNSASVKRVSWSAPKASSTRALTIYGKRLYVLDGSNNMIWRYTKSAGGYDQETAYLKQNTHDLNLARGLAIDSNVYLAFADGTLARYTSGAQDDAFIVRPIDPPLQNLNAIWTSPDIDRLVLLDITGKRLVVLRKDGSLLSQITSPEIKQPTALAVDEVGKKIYLADGSRVLGFDLP